MSSTRTLLTILLAGATAGLAGCAAPSDTGNATAPMVMGNIITGEGFPNPAPNVQANWGQLPEGRMMGTSAGMALDPKDGNIWTYERCGSGSAGGPGINCDSNPVAPIFKFDRKTGAVLANIGAGVMVTPHGIHVDKDGNVWVTDFNNNEAKTKGQQVHKFSPSGELLMSLGVAGQAGNDEKHFNQPNAVVTAPDGSIFVADGHSGQGMLSQQAIDAGIADGQTGRIMKFTADGTFVKQWGKIGTLHGEFRTPHAMAFDAQGRLWVADRGNKRIEIFDQDGNYLESRYEYGRTSGLYIAPDQTVYAIDSESAPFTHSNWVDGVRVGKVDKDAIIGFVPPFKAETRPYQGAAGEGITVDADGNIFAAEGPNSMRFAGGPFTKYSVQAGM
jgi:sugar lactone lactonase YvrE